MNRRLLIVSMLVGLAACRSEHEAPATTAEAVATAEPAPAATATAPAAEVDLETWKKGRVERLTAETGWLTVVGLHWLAEGDSTIGSAEGTKVRLPEGKAPASLGTISLREGVVTLTATAPGVTAEGKPVTQIVMKTDNDEAGPTLIEYGPLQFHIIKRTDRFGVRVKDRESVARKEFKGIEYYPPDPKWRVTARFERYDPPKDVPVQDVVGMTQQNKSPGALVFEIDGQTLRLDPVIEEGSDELFVIFGDKTNGRDTYGAGRYLYTPMPSADGTVVIDFNRAYNPPCAFTNFATCPLPPKQNKLPVRIEAGEKKYGKA